MNVVRYIRLEERAAFPLPHILYHGSPRKFDEFSLDFFGRVDEGYFGEGIYLSPSLEGANGFGPIIYEVTLSNPRSFYLWDDSSSGNTYPARVELSKLPEYVDIAPNLVVPPGYELEEQEDDGNEWRLPRKGWAVRPKPEMYDDQNVQYGDIQPTRDEAIVSFNDLIKYGYNRGPGTVGWTSGLLKYVGLKDFNKALANNGYNCLVLYDAEGIGEVMVVDPSIITIVKSYRHRNKYDIYESKAIVAMIKRTLREDNSISCQNLVTKYPQ
jgi:hypothetical protein